MLVKRKSPSPTPPPAVVVMPKRSLCENAHKLNPNRKAGGRMGN